MKKIYMILAALSLLTLSLNAQMLPSRYLGTPKTANISAAPAGSMANKGQSRAPLRINQDEYTLGPFEGDHVANDGIGYLGYPYAQWIAATTVLNRSEFIGHEGDTIVGFRFALAGDATQTVRVSQFMSLFMSQNGYFDFDNSWFWDIADLSNPGSNTETITYYTYDNIVIELPYSINVRSFTLTRSDDETITWNSQTATYNTVSIDGTDRGVFELPDEWIASSYFVRWASGSESYGYFQGNGNTITIPADLLNGNSSVTLAINAYTDDANDGVTIGDNTQYFLTSGLATRTWTFTATAHTSSSVTIGNGATTNGYLPAYGYMHDVGYKNQMIYSAGQLNMAEGAQISSLTFYPEAGTGIPFSGGTVQVTLSNTTSSTFSGSKITPTGATAVAIYHPHGNHDATTWTLVFDTPLTYTGGNILVTVETTETGDWARSLFLGDDMGSNVSIYSSGSAASGTTGTNSSFLPKATFGYAGGSASADYVDLAGGQWYEYYLDEPVEFVVPGDTVSYLNIGYYYLQHPSTETGELLYPLAVNDESTSHNHMFYMYAPTSQGSTTNGTTDVANGTTTNGNWPVRGLYQDWGYRTQMIYPASLLSNLQEGDQINSLTFYPANGIRFSSSSIVFQLCNTTTANFGTSANSSLTRIAVGSDAVTATVYPTTNNNATTWTINFSTPLTYTGGNLLLDVYCVGYYHDNTGNGSATTTNFYGASQTNYQSFGTNGTSSATPAANKTGSNSQFLPKTTFGYTRTLPPTYEQAWYNLNISQYGDLAVQLIFKESIPKTPQPTITVTSDNSYYYVTATADPSTPNAQVTLTVGGQTATATGSVTIPVGRSDSDYSVTATATAQETGMRLSDPTTQNILIEASHLDPTPTPDIDHQNLDLTVQVVGSGQGNVHMYIDGQEVPLTTYLERTDEDYYVTVTVTAQIDDGEHSMSSRTEQVLVPALDDLDLTDWIQLPGTYTNDKVINWNNNLMFVDRFRASTANNDQPLSYKYVMTEDPIKLIGEPRTTNDHTVPVQWTNSKVFGYYTEQQVLDDTLRQIVDLDLMNALVEMNVEKKSAIYYYTLDRSRNSILDANFLELSELQFDGNRYVEHDNFYTLHEPFNFEGDATSRAINRFDTINQVLPASAPQGIDGKHYGVYDDNDFMSYVPIVWTWGNNDTNLRAFWDRDSVHNSYGSPIWKTSVGKIELMGQPKLERQDGKDGSTNWEEIVGNDTIPCSIFMITDLTAHGFLPNPEASNIKYEPYMFRVWVMSDTTYLRRFEWVDGDPDDIYQRPGTHFEGRGTIPANEPFLVWEEFIADSTTNISYDGIHPDMTIFHKSKIENWATDTTGDVHFVTPQDMNMLFAAQDNLTSSHLTIFVRFYYKSTGEGLYQNQNNNQNGMLLMANRDGGGNGFYGVEGDGDPDPDIPTFIKGVYTSTDHGEVVSTTYYNLQGMQSSQPFEGINIVVTRYSDGTYSTQKVMRR